jgi:hypothetical protein
MINIKNKLEYVEHLEINYLKIIIKIQYANFIKILIKILWNLLINWNGNDIKIDPIHNNILHIIRGIIRGISSRSIMYRHQLILGLN